ncbi:uncharacterized mitochondrial protein-like protein [Tanacetum coccineum]
MDVKSDFLYGKIEEEVYVCQPPGFEDSDFPEEYTRYKGDIFLVQVYVNDIIFGSTKKELCNAFEKLMHEKFQMSSMGELTFFLGFQVQQKKDGIFINQDKYVDEILKKFGFTEVKTTSTPIENQKPLLKDEDGEEVDVHMYRSMIGSLMYLTSSRPDIMFAVCACARYQVNLKVSHLYAMKRIFRYLKGQPKLGLWYPKDSPFDLVAYTNMVANSTTEAEYVAASSCCGQATVKAKTVNGEVQLQALVDGKKIIVTKASVRSDLQLYDEEGMDCLPNATIFEELTRIGYEKISQRKPKRKDTEVSQPSDPTTNVADEAVNEEMDDSVERAATTATSLDAEQDSGNISKTQSKATPNEPSSPGTSSGGGATRQETMGDTMLRLAEEIVSLKRRVKKLEQKKRSRTHGLKRLYKVGSSRRVESSDEEGLGEEDASKQRRIADIDADAGITLASTHFDVDTDMFGVHDLDGDEVIVDNVDVVKTAEETVNVAATIVSIASTIPVSAASKTDVEITLAQALAELKSAKPKADKVMIQEPEQGTTTTTTGATIIIAGSTRPKAKGLVIHEQEQAPTPIVFSQQPSQVKDNGKGKMVEPEPMKKMSKKDQLNLDEELAFKLQAEEEEEEERLAKEKAQQVEEVNIAWDDVQAKVEQRRKHFAAKRAEEKRNRPPTRTQQRSFMCTYLKNIEGWKPKDLKNNPFANIQELFDKAMKRVNTFVDNRTELVEESSKKAEAHIAQESSSKRVGTELEQESIKKQKVDEDKEIAELQRLIEIIPDEEEVAINAIHLATKPPTIVDWKIHKEEKNNYY